MKYQDLCIAIQQIAQHYGVNSVFYEDINLLNSEDVVYPALVCQLKNVALQDSYDRYTLVLTLARVVQDRSESVREDRVTRMIRLDNPAEWEAGRYSYGTGMPTYAGLTNSRWMNIIFIQTGSQVKISNNSADAYGVYAFYRTIGWNALIGNTERWINDYVININQDCYLRLCYDNVSVANVGSLNTQLTIISSNSHTIPMQPIISHGTIRAIIAALNNAHGVQVEDCNVQPFRWKFRDEVEGITAEINLSLFFDSNCN